MAKSKAVRALADQIKDSFVGFRKLVKKYAQNIEVVDPQLKNNADLVAVLQEFEGSWEKGKEYFLNPKHQQQLIHFSSVIEGTMEKHEAFRSQVENREAEIFITIPCLLILKSLEEDDKEICRSFYPDMYDEETKQGRTYSGVKLTFLAESNRCGNEYDYYNYVEKLLISDGMATPLPIVQKIKNLAMELSRARPQDWNKFMNVLIS